MPGSEFSQKYVGVHRDDLLDVYTLFIRSLLEYYAAEQQKLESTEIMLREHLIFPGTFGQN